MACNARARDLAFLPRTLILLGCGVVALTFTGCERPDPAEAAAPRLRLATTTSYLEAAARDLLGNSVNLLRLAEPGTCPGHFDLRPSQVQELRRCDVLLRFDFQQALDARLADAPAGKPALIEVIPGGGLCLPEHYLGACRQVADRLVQLNRLAPEAAEARLGEIATRLDALAERATRRMDQAGWRGRPVIASGRQREFCEWLGLEVVATFSAADTAGIREIEAALAAGKLGAVARVVANRPEGRRAADALADRLGARVVVFDNFPQVREEGAAFDALVDGNLDAFLRND